MDSRPRRLSGVPAPPDAQQPVSGWARWLDSYDSTVNSDRRTQNADVLLRSVRSTVLVLAGLGALALVAVIWLIVLLRPPFTIAAVPAASIVGWTAHSGLAHLRGRGDRQRTR